MDIKTILDDLNKPQNSISKDKIRTYLMETMLSYTDEQNINLYKIFEVSELIRTKHSEKIQTSVAEVVNQLHQLKENLHNSTNNSYNEKDMSLYISKLLDQLTSSYPSLSC